MVQMEQPVRKGLQVYKGLPVPMVHKAQQAHRVLPVITVPMVQPVYKGLPVQMAHKAQQAHRV